MVLAMAWPCAGPRSNVRRISRSRVPCSSSMRSFCSLVDILGENKSLPVECQCESPHDKSRIVEASEEPYSTLWALISITGCRAGEILGLKTTDLDFEKHLIRLRRTLDHAKRTMQAPKSRSSSADLPMPELLEKRLRTFLATHWRTNEADRLFCNSKGRPMQRDKVACKVQEAWRSLRIEKDAVHALSHTAGNGQL